jgi:hypothetical protein
MLVYDILSGISNDIAIAGHLMGNNPVSNLVLRHNRLAMVDDRIKKVDERTTGKDLKDELNKHDAETKVDILYNYIKAKKAAMGEDFGSTTTRRMADRIPESDRRNEVDASLNLGRRATDLHTLTESVPHEEEKEGKVDKEAKHVAIVLGVVMFIVVLGIFIWQSTSGTGNAESSKGLLDALVSVLKIIFE